MTDGLVAGCHFCDALDDYNDLGCTSEFRRIVGQAVSSRTIFQTDNYSVIPTIGAFVDGYVLIVSKHHYPSMSHIPPDQFGELEEVYARVRSGLTAIYQRTLIFEHGPMPRLPSVSHVARGGGACVDHAHFHCVPVILSSGSLNLLKQNLPQYRQIQCLSDLRSQAARVTPYIFLEDNRGIRFVFDAPLVPSQYMRRVIANEVGVPNQWNWQSNPEPDRMLSTLLTVKKYFTGES